MHNSSNYFYNVDSKEIASTSVLQKSPGITMLPSNPTPMPGEDKISYG